MVGIHNKEVIEINWKTNLLEDNMERPFLRISPLLKPCTLEDSTSIMG